MAESAEEASVGGDGSGGVAVDSSVSMIRAPTEHRIRINKWRVREGFAVNSTQVILLYEVLSADGEKVDKTIHKLKAGGNRVGVVKKRLYKDGETVEQGAAILELSECIHATVIKDMCADCGADLRQNENGNISEASVPMVHSIPDLKVTQKLAQKLGHDDTRRLLQDRKLVLLVDLDQTVIHTTNDNVPINIKGIYHFQLYGPHSPWYHTRLRPGTPKFLESMSEYYELHICTFGARNYAHMIAQLLDPDGKFFSHRILSRDECFNATSKTDNLKALFPNGDSMVCIIDDREDVWNMASNLIQVKPYHFFQHTGDINAPPGLSKHELDGEGVDFKELNDLTHDSEKSNKEVENNDSSETTQTVDAKAEANDTEATCKKENTLNEVDKISNITETKAIDVEETVDEKTIEDTPAAAMSTTDEIEVAAVSTASEVVSAALNSTDEMTTSLNSSDVSATSVVDTINKIITVEKKIIEQTTDIVQNATVVNTAVTAAISTKTTELMETVVKEDSQNAQIKTSTCAGIEKEIPTTLNSTLENEQKKQKTDEATISPKIKLPVDPEKQIEIDDPDDYLLYLESILKTIHSRFYLIYDETQEIPDLKIIVPKIRSEVLLGQNLVFSGLVPTNMKLEQSRAYFIAKSLGANVSQCFGPETTHLVAVTSGTFKVNAAKKNAQIKIVNANWLWCCAERWERVEEKLYPLDRKTKSKQRQPPAHCHSPEHVVDYSDKSEISSSSSAQQQNACEPEKFIDTINPLLSFSNADLADMNKEFHQFFESDDSSSEDEPVNIENPPVDKTLRKRKREEKEAERTREFFTRSSDIMLGAVAEGEDPDKSSNEDENVDDDDDEMPSAKFRRGEELPSDLEMGSDSCDSDNNNPDTEDDGDWNMMGAALEREFLGLED